MARQRFQPFRSMFLQLGEAYYEFLPHPLFLDDQDVAFSLEGGSAFIYKLVNVDSGDLYALKVFKPAFRGKYIAAVTESLARYADLAALQTDRRLCITGASYPELVDSYPELEYAILMPWISGPTWTGILLNPQLSATYTLRQARDLIQAATTILTTIEAHGFAHADIAGGNLILSPDGRQLQLLDAENMYIPGIPAPQKKSQGTPGYQHKRPGPRGQWCPEGDRFASAILFTEILTWWDSRVRARVAEGAESLFSPEELQTADVPCLPTVRDVLYTFSPQLLELFDQAWLSRTLADCPPLHAWAAAL